MALKQCNLSLSSAAVRKQSVFVKTAESVNLVEIPESSTKFFPQMFWLYKQGAAARASLRCERELKAPHWDRTAWWTSTPAEPASPWNKLELLSSWAPALPSPYFPTGACQPTVHTAGDKRERWGAGGGITTDSGWSGDDLVSVCWVEGGGCSDTFQVWRLMAQKTSKTMSKTTQTGEDKESGRGWNDGWI